MSKQNKYYIIKIIYNKHYQEPPLLLTLDEGEVQSNAGVGARPDV